MAVQDIVLPSRLMPRKLFVYKCNRPGTGPQLAYGDWQRFFGLRHPTDWGSDQTMSSPLSLKILRQEFSTDDLVLCWQTDLKSAVGLCRVDRLKDYRSGEREIWPELVGKPFVQPVKLLELKQGNPVLANAH